MEHVRIVTHCHAVVSVQFGDVDRLINVDHVLALRMHLDQHLEYRREEGGQARGRCKKSEAALFAYSTLGSFALPHDGSSGRGEGNKILC